MWKIALIVLALSFSCVAADKPARLQAQIQKVTDADTNAEGNALYWGALGAYYFNIAAQAFNTNDYATALQNYPLATAAIGKAQYWTRLKKQLDVRLAKLMQAA